MTSSSRFALLKVKLCSFFIIKVFYVFFIFNLFFLSILMIEFSYLIRKSCKYFFLTMSFSYALNLVIKSCLWFLRSSFAFYCLIDLSSPSFIVFKEIFEFFLNLLSFLIIRVTLLDWTMLLFPKPSFWIKSIVNFSLNSWITFQLFLP